MGPYEINIRFYLIQPFKRLRFVQCMFVCSPQFAKAFAMYLGDRIAGYEKNFGCISADERFIRQQEPQEGPPPAGQPQVSARKEKKDEDKEAYGAGKESGVFSGLSQYVNYASVIESVYDFSFCFKHKSPDSEHAQETVIMMSPQHAKAFSLMLSGQMKAYETAHGKLTAPKDELDLPYFRKQFGIE